MHLMAHLVVQLTNQMCVGRIQMQIQMLKVRIQMQMHYFFMEDAHSNAFAFVNQPNTRINIKTDIKLSILNLTQASFQMFNISLQPVNATQFCFSLLSLLLLQKLCYDLFSFYFQVITANQTWTVAKTTRAHRARTALTSLRQNKCSMTSRTIAAIVRQEQKRTTGYVFVSISYRRVLVLF